MDGYRLSGRKVLVTGGPTRAYLDKIRYITNHSTGKMGILLAQWAVAMGAEVLYVQGKGSLAPGPSPRLRVVGVETVEELSLLIEREVGSGAYDAVVHSMAVLDFQPERRLQGKVSSRRTEWVIRLVPAPKVVNRIKELDPDVFLVAFKLEVLGRHGAGDEALALSARRLMASSRADIVVANAFETVHDDAGHQAHIFLSSGEAAMVRGKEAIARAVISFVARMLPSLPEVQRGGEGV